MKRSWLSIIIFAGLIGLLVVLAIAQYRWQTVASEADREKLQVRVDADVNRFADEFNREIQAVFMNFQFDSSGWNLRENSQFNERLAAWKESAEDPDLITSFYFFPMSPQGSALRFDPKIGKFEPLELDENISSLRASVDKDIDRRNFFKEQTAIAIPVSESLQRERFVIRVRTTVETMPSKAEKPARLGSLVLMLDKDVIDQKMLPRLAEKYFGDGEFRVSVVDSAGQELYSRGKEVTQSDATASLMSILPGNFMFFTKTVKGSPIDEKKGEIVTAQRLETRTFKRVTATAETNDEINVKVGSNESSFGDDSVWRLNVQHSAGSIDAFIRSERNKNLALGFGIYLLLIAGISAIVLSAMRAKRLAQRQLDFVSSVSHEFRTPLAVIYSAGENLADGVAVQGERVEQYGDLIKGEGKKLSAMVEQILQFAGTRSGKQKYDLRDADTKKIIDDAVAECQPMIDEKEFLLEKEIADDLPKISADSGALSRAIQNLIVNSTKYSNGNHSLKITAKNGGGNVKITIEDQGIGISKKDQAHIFEPFYRAKDVVDEQIHGNGLGLSLVKQIVEAHKGKVKVESEIGKGSKFTIQLPAN